jgi:uncharacterized protein (TIGR02246 family)
MKKAIAVCVLAFATLTAGAAAAADDGLKTVESAWTKAVLAGDAAALAALYADDAVLVMPGSPAAKGGKAIGESFAAFLKDTKVTEFALMDSHYRSAGHISTGWGAWKMTTVPKAGGAPTTEIGTWWAVAAETNGVWKYVSDHASADPPPPAKK